MFNLGELKFQPLDTIVPFTINKVTSPYRNNQKRNKDFLTLYLCSGVRDRGVVFLMTQG